MVSCAPARSKMHPGVCANDGLDQTLVVRSFRYNASFYCGCYVLLGRPCNSDFLAVLIGTSSGNYQQSIAVTATRFSASIGSSALSDPFCCWCV